MSHTTSITDINNPSFINELLQLSDAAKRRIIHLLVDSLSTGHRTEEKVRTDFMLKKYAGAWKGDNSVDDIMKMVREGSSVREPLKF